MASSLRNGRPVRHAGRLFLRVLFALALLLAVTPAPAGYAQEVQPANVAAINNLLAQDLATATAPVSFLVVLKDQLDPAAVWNAADVRTANANERRARLYAQLTAHAAATQAPLREWLAARGVTYRPFYLVNMIEVYGDQALADQLRLRPEVDRLARNPQLTQTNAAPTQLAWLPLTPLAPDSTNLPYGLVYTKANLVWDAGYHGEGVVVASQDTGVKWDHPALINAYRGWNSSTQTVTHVYNWYDAFGRDSSDFGCSQDAQVPCDDQGHGTHTVGTMVGDARSQGQSILGMAPAAKWIACRNMRQGTGTPASYTACFQFFLAPFPQGGNAFTDGKPELAPNIINNSWGCPPSEGCDAASLRQVVDTVRAAGIFVAASAGNYGPNCSSVADPIAIYDSAFSVGAHDAEGQLAYFSSRGPVTIDGSNRRKPDLAAPGVAVYSSYPPNSYNYLSGTSMASPHLAGAVALLWSAVPSLVGDIDRTEQVLLKGAQPVLSAECSSNSTPASPNNLYGYGNLDVQAAVDLARHTQQLDVSLRDSNGNPISATAVSLVDARTGYSYPADNFSVGSAHWSSVYLGDYEVIADLAGGNQYRFATTIGFERSWLPMIYNESTPK